MRKNGAVVVTFLVVAMFLAKSWFEMCPGVLKEILGACMVMGEKWYVARTAACSVKEKGSI
jgi:hypothetical protein